MPIYEANLRSIFSDIITALHVWQFDGGLVAQHGELLLTDRAALRPDVSPRNIRHRWQIIKNDREQTLVALFRSRAEAERYLYSA